VTYGKKKGKRNLGGLDGGTEELEPTHVGGAFNLNTC
jgi:hypothetical protein